MYVSLDIETTGLDPRSDQILSVGIVVDDMISSIKDLKKLYLLVSHSRVSGNPFAMAMNAGLLKQISKKEISEVFEPDFNVSSRFVSQQVILKQIEQFVKAEGKFTLAGKNVGAFDLQFLKALSLGMECDLFHHRILDVGSIYYDPKIHGDTLPNLDQCKKMAGIVGDVTHNALDDAVDVVKCVRYKYGIPF